MGYFDDYFFNDQQETEVKVKGRNHTGMFSPNNPYMKQLEVATNRKDRDKLYAQAVEWEAGQANLQQETNLDYAKLLEQRQYDSDVERVKRAREAGINLDVAGASGAGSGGSASPSIPASDLQQQETPGNYSNEVENKALAIQALSGASNFISSLSSFVGVAVNGFAKLRKLPSEIALSGAQAQAVTTQASALALQANTASRLADSRIATDDLARISQRISLLERLSQDITPTMSDEDALGILSTLGYSGDDGSNMLNNIRTYHKNPNLRAYHSDKSVEANFAEARAKSFTPHLISDIVSYNAQAEHIGARTTFLREQIEGRVASIISKSNYAEDVAGATITGAEMSRQSVEQDQKMLEYDIAVWAQQVERIRNSVNDVQKAIEATVNSGADPAEIEARVEVLQLHYTHLMTLGSREFGTMYDILNNVYMQTYHTKRLMDGGLDNVTTEAEKQFVEMTFGKFMQNGMTGRDLATSITQQFLNVGLGIAGVKGARGKSPAPTTTTTTVEKYNKKKGYIPYSRTITTN